MSVYRFDTTTFLYIGEETEITKEQVINSPYVYTDLTIIAPPTNEINKYKWDLTSNTWEIVTESHIGETIWNINTKQSEICTYSGPLKINYTNIPIPIPELAVFYKFDINLNKWVGDETKIESFQEYIIQIMNKNVEKLIETSTVEFTNENGSIHIYTDKENQLRYTGILTSLEFNPVTFPYFIYDKQESLLLTKIDDLYEIGTLIRNKVTELLTNNYIERTKIYSMTFDELINKYQELNKNV